MNTSKAIEILSNIKNGTFGVVEYETEVPVNKEAKKAGVKIYCKTKKMVRFGAAYENLISKDIEIVPRKTNYEWVIKNKITHNNNTEKDYLRISNINRKTISREYCMVTSSSIHHFDKLELAEKFLRPSMTVPVYQKPLVQNISMENIISINGIM